MLYAMPSICLLWWLHEKAKINGFTIDKLKHVQCSASCRTKRTLVTNELARIAITLIGLQRRIALCKRISQELNWVKTGDKETAR